ncbi:MAG: hypothetical protein K2Y29_00480 [Beijerinckiaceae bacterium]|nr:hypothetical protein [Beijerinckiaceae bacterium]
MATSLEQLQTKRDELVQALGVAGIRTGEDSIQYGDIEKALRRIDREIARLQSSTSRRSVAGFSNGT